MMKINLKLGIIVCVAAILALVAPAAADNSTTTDNSTSIVHGVVYSLDTFEPLDNAVVYVNSIPAQSMVARYGMYSFELEPGNYTITAKYYQNSTVTYSVDDIVNIKNKGNYVHDLLLLPVYSEELMGSSRVNGSSNNSASSAGNPVTEVAISNINNSKGVNATMNSGFYTPPANYLLIAILTLVLLSAAGYKLSRKHKKIGKTSREEKTIHKIKEFSRPANTLELSAKISDKSPDPGIKKDSQACTEGSVSATRQVTESEPKISLIESVIEPEFKRPEGGAQSESRDKYPAQETELPEPGLEDEIRKASLEKSAYNPEIGTPDPKKKFPLTSDLQEVMDIIRGQRGRITQKDLCSRLKCSDAKVSLMLADLEKRELIEKFKKGRGNVVTLRDEER
jgi:uncharacterized membrane protein